MRYGLMREAPTPDGAETFRDPRRAEDQANAR
jgi:hypothetical protein